jgi:hypothetical protein
MNTAKTLAIVLVILGVFSVGVWWIFVHQRNTQYKDRPY